jgi:hypothetical protein
VNLSDIADLLRPMILQRNENGSEVIDISPSDFAKSGYTVTGNKKETVLDDRNKFDDYAVKSNDLLISIKGTIGKVAIIGDLSDDATFSQLKPVLLLDLKTRNKQLLFICS